MRVARVLRLETFEERSARRPRPKRKARLKEGALHPGRLVLHETAHEPVKEVVRGLEGRDQKLLEASLDVAREK